MKPLNTSTFYKGEIGMHKLKHSLLLKLFKQKLTKEELNTVWFLCMHQDQSGLIIGVHYKMVAEFIDCCAQTFYNVLKSLQEKGIISVTQKETGDYDIYLIGNDFSDGDFTCGYINLRKKFFKSKVFMQLKANEMLLVMELLYRCGCHGGMFKIGRSTFIKNFMEEFGVTARTIERYLHMIRHYFRITLKGKNYIFVPKAYTKQSMEKRDEDFCNEYQMRVMARRSKIKKTSEQEIVEAAKLINQYKAMAAERGKDIWELFRESLGKSLEWLNRDKGVRDRKKYSLEYKLIHKIMRDTLQLV